MIHTLLVSIFPALRAPSRIHSVESERMRILMTRELTATLTAPMAYLILGWLAWGHVATPRILLWMGLLFAGEVINFCVCLRFLQGMGGRLDERDFQAWRRRLRLSLFAVGVAWGLTAPLLGNPAEPVYQVIELAFVAVMVAFCVIVLAPYADMFVAFSAPAILGSLLHCMLHPSAYSVPLALGLLVFYGVALQYAQITRQDLVQGLHLAKRNQELVRTLQLAKALSDRANVELTRVNGELVNTLQRLNETAVRDELTGSYNRRHLLELARVECARAQRHALPLSVAIADVDYFKSINDRHGHLVGDAVLRRFAMRCRDALRQSDIFARYGGEEFVWVMPMTSLEDAALISDRIKNMISAEPMRHGEIEVDMTISIGIARFEPGETLDQLLSRADNALYKAKRSGRNRVVLAD